MPRKTTQPEFPEAIDVHFKGHGWLTTALVAEVAGAPVVVRLTIEPEGETPPGGISTRQLREISIPDCIELAREAIAYMSRGYVPARDDIWKYFNEPGGRRPGRPGHPDEYYAEVAREYGHLIDEGERRPIVAIARRRGLSEERVRQLVHKARDKGFLSPASRGRAGGYPTKRAFHVLAEDEKRRDEH
jgi:hypothetical protein